MPWFQFTIRRMMVYVILFGVFLWGCMGVSARVPYSHFAIVLAIIGVFADLGWSITYEGDAGDGERSAGDSGDFRGPL